jgi:Raf kinase inhibitor-like YbhB/YbcL family protein
MTLTTTAFPDGGEIPAKYTQAVPTPVSPALAWSNTPAGVVTFALTVLDPDVAAQRNPDGFSHWVLFNIPPATRELPEAVPTSAQLPDGSVQGKNGRNLAGFLGPGAPAPGPHHQYTFELFALDTRIDLSPDATRADLLKAMAGHVLAKAVLVGRFHR